MYYAAAEPANILGKHGIAYRKSRDLKHWGARSMAFVDATSTTPWAEHSFIRFPQLLQRDGAAYLLAGPLHNNNLSRYHCLHIFRSDDPFAFSADAWFKRIFVDAGGKVLQDGPRLYVSTSSTLGLSQGVWLAPLHWRAPSR